MKTTKTTESPVYQFISLAWNNSKGASWKKLESVLFKALAVAIEAGFRFERADFRRIHTDFSGEHWFGHSQYHGDCGDLFYSMAVQHRNVSACQSFETFAGRKPFVYGGSRMSCRDQVNLGGEVWTVSSFDDSKGLIRLVNPSHWHHGMVMPEARMSLTVEEVQGLERARKAKARDLSASSTGAPTTTAL